MADVRKFVLDFNFTTIIEKSLELDTPEFRSKIDRKMYTYSRDMRNINVWVNKYNYRKISRF